MSSVWPSLCMMKRSGSFPSTTDFIEEDVQMLSDWDFPVWEFNRDELTRMAFSMFHHLGLVQKFNISGDVFCGFMRAVFDTSHKEVSYHNFFHWISVMQSTWHILITHQQITSYFSEVELLSIMTAAICHDLDHPGLSNRYLKDTDDKLALLYNDTSILEMHHAATLFKILKKTHCNIWANLSQQDYKTARQVAISAILNTDMVRHFDLIKQFKDKFQDKGGKLEDCLSQANDRSLVLSMIIHAADISNPAKKWLVSKRCADDLRAEFKNQAQREASVGLEPTPHMHDLDTDEAQAQMEIQFGTVFTQPTFEALKIVFPNIDFTFKNMEENRIKWQAVIDNSRQHQQTNGAAV